MGDVTKGFDGRLRNFDVLWKLLDLFRVLSTGKTGSYLRFIEILLDAAWRLAWGGVELKTERQGRCSKIAIPGRNR